MRAIAAAPRAAASEASARFAAPRPPDRAFLDLGTKPRFEIAIYGDLFFGEQYQAAREAAGMPNVLKERGYDAQLDPFRSFMAGVDANIVNLEAPLTTKTDSPFAGVKTYNHAGDPVRSIEAIKRANVHGALLGNNHMLDQGPIGLADTLDALDAAGIKWAGAGRDAGEALTALTITGNRGTRTFRVIILSAWQYRPTYETKFAFYAAPDRPGVADLRGFPQAIARYRRDYPDALIVASPHWGRNYVWRLDWQDSAAAAVFAAGADVVIAHGAHMLQEIVRIGRSWVVHGIGNFVFLSRGRHAQFNAPPYSLIARLAVGGGRRYDDFLLRLYPIVTNNEMTDFHPRFVDDTEFDRVLGLLRTRSPSLASATGDVWFGGDEHGRYIEMRVR